VGRRIEPQKEQSNILKENKKENKKYDYVLVLNTGDNLERNSGSCLNWSRSVARSIVAVA
jgi:hypothetical protein